MLDSRSVLTIVYEVPELGKDMSQTIPAATPWEMIVVLSYASSTLLHFCDCWVVIVILLFGTAVTNGDNDDDDGKEIKGLVMPKIAAIAINSSAVVTSATTRFAVAKKCLASFSSSTTDMFVCV